MDSLTKAEKKELRKHERHVWEESIENDLKKKKRNKILSWLVTVVIGALLLWGISILVNTPASTEQSIKLPPINQKDISTGGKNAKVTLVEYADFQCPTCGLYHPILKKLLQDYKGNILFIYRFFPLPSIHQNAIPAAKAAYAANLQGKFWEMHDLLFEHQKDWSLSNDPESIFITYANSLSLDIDKFKKDFDADSTIKFINDEENTGTTVGIAGTPTFFLNGKQIQNPLGYEPFKKLIDDQLKKT